MIFKRENFEYDSETGKLFKNGKPCTFVDKLNGYEKMTVKAVSNYCTHVIWWIVYGKKPSKVIDHINRIRSDNRLINLQEISKNQNDYRRQPNKKSASGCRGVHKRGKRWNVQFEKDKKVYRFGRFSNLSEAVDVANKAAKELYGEFAFINKSVE